MRAGKKKEGQDDIEVGERSRKIITSICVFAFSCRAVYRLQVHACRSHLSYGSHRRRHLLVSRHDNRYIHISDEKETGKRREQDTGPKMMTMTMERYDFFPITSFPVLV
jgi:hypothetical protein